MAVTTQQLAEAEAAYHSLLMGTAVRVFVDQNGEKIEYAAANRGALAVYIQDLKRQLGLLSGTGPMQVWF